jgi:hypothetical protein
LCHRTPSDIPASEGWIHHLVPRERRFEEEEVKDCWPDVRDAAARMTPSKRRALGRELQIPEGATAKMSFLGVGKDAGGDFYLFPMWDGAGDLCGYSRRYRDGKKSWGRNGLFLPVSDPGGDVVLIVEGASDVLAAAAMGIYALGRPSNTGGVEQLAMYLRMERRLMVVIGENDEKPSGQIPGWTGMMMVRDQLGPRLRPASVMARPTPDGCKDLREWAIKYSFDGKRLSSQLAKGFPVQVTHAGVHHGLQAGAEVAQQTADKLPTPPVQN